MNSNDTAYAWKNKNTKEILQSKSCNCNFTGGLYETKKDAFEDFRSFIGQENLCESIQDNYTLVEITDLNKNPHDFSDCMNCVWGVMKLDKDNWYVCDNCGYSEFHN